MDYFFASGKIKVLEKKLPNRVDVDRMVDSENYEKAFQVFHDTDLSDNLLNVLPHHYEKAVYKDMAQMRDLIKKISNDDQKLFQFLFLKHDFHNIKLLLKLKIKGEKDYEDNLVPFAIYDSQKMADYILLNNYKNFPDGELKDSIEELFKNSSLEAVDNLCDKEYFRLLLKIAEEIKDDFLMNIVFLEIDFANLRIILRGGRDKIKNFYIPGGSIELNKLLEISSQEDGVLNYLKFYLSKSGQKTFERFFNEKKLWQFEQAFDNFLLSELKLARFVSSGPAVVVAYVLAKELAFRNVRIIMNAKINEITTDVIGERVRNVF